MTDRAARRLAWGTGVICFLLVAVSLAMLALDWKAIDSPFTAQLPWFIAAGTTGVLGVLIATRRPRHPIGWLLLAISLGDGINLASDFIAMHGLLTGAPATTWVEWPAWVFNWSGGAGALLLLLMIVVFPDGRLPSARWRWIIRLAVVLGVLTTALTLLDAGPSTLSPRLPNVPAPINLAGLSGGSNGVGLASAVINVAPFVLLAITVAAVVFRFRRSRDDERRQLKWFAYVAGAAIIVVLSSYLFQGPVGNDVAGTGFDFGLGVALPLTVGLAVMRYGLYDIDLFISRSIVYGSLAVFITAVYVGIAVGIGALVGSAGKPNLGLSILATAIVALGFQAVRERLQRVANRLVYGTRATPYEVLSEFSGRVADTYAAEDVLPRMARVLQEGTGAESATVWLRSGGQLRPAATYPESQDGLTPVHVHGNFLPDGMTSGHIAGVEQQGELLGALSVVKRRGEALTPIELKLVHDLAGQAGLVLKNVRLTAELLQRLEDLRVSRQRLVQAQDEERRRLERNLHDGAQQHLVALKVKLGLVETLLMRNPQQATTLLDQLTGDADDALETLRDLARGIYPPLLAEKGLAVALQSQARKATLPVEVDADGIGRFSQEVEATVYFCVLEALQNVQKYAGASRVTVRLSDESEQLRFEVVDDGAGFDAAAVAAGMGLTNMRDRIDTLLGSLRVSSAVGHGTSVSGTIPVAARGRAVEALMAR